MSHHKHNIFQLFLSFTHDNQTVVSAAELVRIVEKNKSDWISKYPELDDIINHEGLLVFARLFCQRYSPEGLGSISVPYLDGFPHLSSWEKKVALKFEHRTAYVPSAQGHIEVCRMTPQQRVDAGNAGIKNGQDTIERYKILKTWGLRGGGQE